MKIDFSKSDSTQNIIDVAAELDVSVEKIERVSVEGRYLNFYVGNTWYFSKLTATGKHMKNSVRHSTH